MQGEGATDATVEHEAICASITILLSIILCIFCLFEKISLHLSQFILNTIVRPFLYATHSAYISIAFPTEHFGTLYGFAFFCASIYSLFNYPLFEITVSLWHGNFSTIMLLCLCCFISQQFTQSLSAVKY